MGVIRTINQPIARGIGVIIGEYPQGYGTFDSDRYPPNAPTNNKPVITLIGNQQISILITDTYNELGAVALDYEDGDISSSIIITSNLINGVAGNYIIRYNVNDSNGSPATPVTRNVEVVV